MRTYLTRFTILGLLFLTAAACDRTEAKSGTPATVQDTMLLHDLAQANRNTASLDADTTPVLVSSRGTGRSTPMIDVGGGGRSSPAPANPALHPPKRANDAPAPTNVPPMRTSSDPCDSPGADDQRACLNRSIASSDADLNRVYQELVSQARTSGGAELEERFRVKQRAWIITRDEECRRETRSEEGALWARVRARCLGEWSARRTRELQESLNSLRGR